MHAIYASVALHALTLSAIRLKIHYTAAAFLSRRVRRRLPRTHLALLLGFLEFGSGSGLKFREIREENQGIRHRFVLLRLISG